MERVLTMMKHSQLLLVSFFFLLVVIPTSSLVSLNSTKLAGDHHVELDFIGAAPTTIFLLEVWTGGIWGLLRQLKTRENAEACWAFSAVAAVESALWIAERRRGIRSPPLISLSEQELIDCDTNNRGCECGFPSVAFDWIRTRGLVSQQQYPYGGNEGTCNYDWIAHRHFIANFLPVTPRTEWELQVAVAKGPVSVAVMITEEWNRYRGDKIIRASACPDIPVPDHAVTVVGYDTTPNGLKYWIVKNSWGHEWGDGGYLYLERDVGRVGGTCGIAFDAAYPIIR